MIQWAKEKIKKYLEEKGLKTLLAALPPFAGGVLNWLQIGPLWPDFISTTVAGLICGVAAFVFVSIGIRLKTTPSSVYALIAGLLILGFARNFEVYFQYYSDNVITIRKDDGSERKLLIGPRYSVTGLTGLVAKVAQNEPIPSPEEYLRKSNLNVDAAFDPSSRNFVKREMLLSWCLMVSCMSGLLAVYVEGKHG